MFQSREKLGRYIPERKKISRLLSAKQPADLRAPCLKNHFQSTNTHFAVYVTLIRLP